MAHSAYEFVSFANTPTSLLFSNCVPVCSDLNPGKKGEKKGKTNGLPCEGGLCGYLLAVFRGLFWSVEDDEDEWLEVLRKELYKFDLRQFLA